jgi:predicted permease
VEQLWHDIANAVCQLARKWRFSLVIVSTLALAIGANSAIFSLLDQTVLRPLPVERPDELVILESHGLPYYGGGMVGVGLPGKAGKGIIGVSYPMYAACRDRAPLFKDTMAYGYRRVTLLVNKEAEEGQAVLATGNYFRFLGAQTALGRPFSPGDDQLSRPNPVAVLSHRYWQNHLGGNPAVLNRSILVNNFSVTIIGVTAPGFEGIDTAAAPDLFLPLSLHDAITPKNFLLLAGGLQSPGLNMLKIMARLRPGMTRASAEAQADSLYRQWVEEAVQKVTDPRMLSYAQSPKERSRVQNLHLKLLPGGFASDQASHDVSRLSQALILLMGLAALVLVIAAVNVANLLLARGAGQARELAIRLSLGASRWQLLRTRLIDNLLLAAMSGALSLLASQWIGGLLLLLLPLGDQNGGLSIQLDGRLITFTALISVATGMTIWGCSALKITHRTSLPPLTTSTLPIVKPSRLRQSLVLVQMALSLALLCAASFFSHSLYRLLTLDFGFESERLTVFTLAPLKLDETQKNNRDFYLKALREIQTLPGVVAATIASSLPLAGGGGIALPANPLDPVGGNSIFIGYSLVGPAYFATLHQPLIRGRDFSAHDIAESSKGVVINETLARQLFGTQDPLGRRLPWGPELDQEVIGVAKDIRTKLRGKVEPSIFVPLLQNENPNQITMIVRTEKPGILSLATVREAVNRIDPANLISNLRSLNEVVRSSLLRDRILAILSLSFSLLAVMLSAAGLFGLTSFSIAMRRKEIGVRLAVGAPPRSIIRLILREVMGLTLIGSGLGLALYWGFHRMIQSMLFGMSSLHLLTLAVAVLTLAIVTLTAGFIPARQASRFDPALILREE